MSFLPMPTSWAARNLEGGGFWRTDQCEMGTMAHYASQSSSSLHPPFFSA